jgi:hypothetical protein
MRDCTEMFNESGEHIATIGFNETLWPLPDRGCPAQGDGVVLSKQGGCVRRLARRIRSRNWIPAIGFTRWLRCLT